MFTGLVTEIGTIQSTHRTSSGLRLVVRAPRTVSEAALGDSIDINGACQTAMNISGDAFSVDTVPETLKKTTLGELRIGSRVNLEQAVKASDRLGGHIVSGHIDCVGTVVRARKLPTAIELAVSFPEEFADLVVPQGSIAIDGVSLTVAALKKNECTVAIIPTTWEMTTLSDLKSGSRINLEFDVMGKYIVNYLRRRNATSGIDENKLRELGY
ncbi:MAG: riboflavin synthase [Candidatus Zixiibacteriota bacterium]